MKKYFQIIIKITLFIYATLLVGCNPHLASEITIQSTPVQNLGHQSKKSNHSSSDQSTSVETASRESASDETESDQPRSKKEVSNQTSKMIQLAYQVVATEGKKLGTACNHYVARVLQLMGFKKGRGFLSNTFDQYAKIAFNNYKARFVDKESELRNLMWSYPSRTGFIFQWKRDSDYGHIAIVERVGESIYLYHASLNRHTPRIVKVSLAKLMAVNKNAGLTVYSDIE